MSQDAKYSLWIEPPPYIAMRFNSLIEALAREHAGPLFTSHITLLGSISGDLDELKAHASKLSSASGNFEVRLESLGHEDDHYRCLYLLAEPSSELLSLRHEAERVFVGSRDVPLASEIFKPHMSILYGNINQEAKANLINTLGSALGCNFRAEGVSLYKTDGPPARWSRVGGPYNFSWMNSKHA